LKGLASIPGAILSVCLVVVGSEWTITALVLFGTVLLLARGPKAGGWWLAAPCLALGLGCAWTRQQHLRLREESRSSLTTPGIGRPEQYVTSVTCQACHPDQYASCISCFIAL
jgi:hypothetical protein